MKKQRYFTPDVELCVVSVERGYLNTIGGGDEDNNQENIGETKPDGTW